MAPSDGAGGVSFVHVTRREALTSAISAAGLVVRRPVVVVVGGANGMDRAALSALDRVLRDVIVPAVRRHGATVVDGGTDSGVMRLVGRARAAEALPFPLVGVAAVGTVIVPGGEPPSADAAPLEPHHSQFLLVPGAEWGAEVPWIADVASIIAGDQPSATVLANGGEIAYADAAASIHHGRPLLVLSGTGRTADSIAAAHVGRHDDPRAVAVAASPLVTVADVTDQSAVGSALALMLGETSKSTDSP